MQAFREMGIEVHVSAWNSIFKTDEAQSPRTTSHFVETTTEFINGLPQDTEVYFIGHSFGGDSILQFLNSYRRQHSGQF